MISLNMIQVNYSRMRKVIVLIICALMAACQTSQPLKQVVRVPLDFSQYQLAFNKDNSDGQGSLRLYVPRGQTLDNWQQMISVQSLVGFNRSLSLTMHKLQETVYDECGASNVKWEVLQQTNQSILFEKTIRQCPKQPDQYEMTRLIAGIKDLHLVSYSSKTLRQSKQNRIKWARTLNSAFVEVVNAKGN